MIRKAEERDIGRVKELLSQVLEVHAKGRPDIFISGTTKYQDEELKGIFNDENTPVFVCTDESDTVLGYAFCIFQETKGCNNMHDMKTLYIDDICVDENHRRKHVASDLYKYVKEFARESGCYNMTLNVWALNGNAQKFYERMGMVPLKTAMETILKED